MILTIIIPGPCIPKARPRVSHRGGNAHAYTPRKSADYEALVREFAALEMRKYPITPSIDRVSIVITVYRPLPKNASKKFLTMVEWGTVVPLTKPDVDNYAKSICDALNGLVYKDDSQITELHIRKRYDDGGGTRTVVTIEADFGERR